MIQYYADSDVSGNITAFYNDDIWEVAKIPTSAIDITEVQWQDCVANQGKWIVKSGALALAPAPTAAQLLTTAQDAKNAEIKTNADSNLTTFKSSALGTVHTYLSGMNDMLLLTGEYAFVKGSDYDNSAILWYTVENGNLSHTGAQFIKIYLDARLNVQTIKYRQATKEAQVGACTTTAQVATIGWPNPNPPTVPTGLAGTAGATGSGQVTLNWTANSEVTMVGGGGYNVYVDGVKTNAALVTTATYSATGLAVGAHTFAITAVDTDGLESAQCTAVTVTTS